MYYTIGQRKGLGIGGVAGVDETPWFVVAKELQRNTLVVAQGHDHPMLLMEGLQASQMHWISGRPPSPLPFHCKARLRHRQPLQDCTLQSMEDNLCRVYFEQPQRAVTPGQSIVFYLNNECLGGAIIEQGFSGTS
jgi:tRNA-specific 2-thiouridylase